MPKGFPIALLDMYQAEDRGLHKFDILSQRGLGHIKDTVALVHKNRGEVVNVHDLYHIKQDEQVKCLLRSGQCMGCFYIESPAMRGLLQKLQCDNYVHLVAASSIIRPGVAKSGMMREYIQCFHQPDGFEYLHPVFEEHLGETFGIMVYQEDVMKILHHFAGLDLDESDVLRRIMSGKKHRKDTLDRLRQKYFDNCRQRGHPEVLAQEVWRQIESFSGYSFCKAHSASFAVESFQSLFLKAYYPLEFMVAVINNFGGFYSTEYYLHEARMLGGTVHAPCINHSQYLTDLQGKDIYLGFIHIKQMEQKTARRLLQERAVGGPFQNMGDFLRRVPISEEQVELLIRIGAFRFTGQSRPELMWEKSRLLSKDMPSGSRTGLLFAEPPASYALPDFEETPEEETLDQIELLGFPLSSPFTLLHDAARAREGCIVSAQLRAFRGRHVQLLGYYVCRKTLRTSKGQLMSFGTWIDERGRFFDSVHFPDSLRRSPFRGKGIYRLSGRVTEEFGFHCLEVTEMKKWALDRSVSLPGFR